MQKRRRGNGIKTKCLTIRVGWVKAIGNPAFIRDIPSGFQFTNYTYSTCNHPQHHHTRGKPRGDGFSPTGQSDVGHVVKSGISYQMKLSHPPVSPSYSTHTTTSDLCNPFSRQIDSSSRPRPKEKGTPHSKPTRHVTWPQQCQCDSISLCSTILKRLFNLTWFRVGWLPVKTCLQKCKTVSHATFEPAAVRCLIDAALSQCQHAWEVHSTASLWPNGGSTVVTSADYLRWKRESRQSAEPVIYEHPMTKSSVDITPIILK